MRRALALCLLLLACPLRAHEGWGLVVHDRLGVVFADIPGNTIWRVKGGRVEALRPDVHSHA